ncbi:uncharacterized protein EI90DRAFT_3131532 [Cantharellus anzutake]|uniref:uncharacterized protein n=1 Tax=Cantharellus anzutake TaxID=1750568 RepID=UPI0019077AF1|nr:uncharacterized protein EI90DRAFT_3131532 [Cantharellus anzutake]KAF8321875.1 hypothetical protein EI90DRAFT_3131532 [Cantharellus anzutake]
MATLAPGARYDNVEIPLTEDPLTAVLQNVVATDLDMRDANTAQITAAALNHLKRSNSDIGAHIQVRHGAEPVNHYSDPHLLPLLYPTLFPYGIGGYHRNRRASLSLEKMATHVFSLADHRFQEHYSFLFVIFNIIQRQRTSLYCKLKTSQAAFDRVATAINAVSADALNSIADRLTRGDYSTMDTADELAARKLLQEVSLVSTKVPGSHAACTQMRNEIRALIFDHGPPSFFVTINPADVYNPIVKFLSGDHFDLDEALPTNIPSYWDCHIHAYPILTRLPDLLLPHLRSHTLQLPVPILTFGPGNTPPSTPHATSTPPSLSSPISIRSNTHLGPNTTPLATLLLLLLLLRSSFTTPPPFRHPPMPPPSALILTFGPDYSPSRHSFSLTFLLSPLSGTLLLTPHQVTTFHHCSVLRTRAPLVSLLRASVIVPTSDFDSTSVLVHCIGDLILRKHHCQYSSDFQPRLRNLRKLRNLRASRIAFGPFAACNVSFAFSPHPYLDCCFFPF